MGRLTVIALSVLALAALALAGCGGEEQAKQKKQVEPIDWPRLKSTVNRLAKQRIFASGRQPWNLHCLRADETIFPGGKTKWSCTFEPNDREAWEWVVVVDRDGHVVKSKRFGHSYDLEPQYTPEQKPWAYWTGYTWCRKYRELFLGPLDDVGGDYYRTRGESPTLAVEDEGCEDGFRGSKPAVNRPEGFRLTGVSPVQDFE
jgi:hypothetical protein